MTWYAKHKYALGIINVLMLTLLSFGIMGCGGGSDGDAVATSNTLTATVTPENASPINGGTTIVIAYSRSMDVSSLSLNGSMAAESDGGVWSSTSEINDTLTISPLTLWSAGTHNLGVFVNDLNGNNITSDLNYDANYTVSDSGGVPAAGYPNWEERTLLVLTNAVRMDPQGWRDTYYPQSGLPDANGTLLPSNYPATAPVYYHYDLNQAARFHSDDMATNSLLQHNSSDGTSIYDRVNSFLSQPISYLAENIAKTANNDPFFVLNFWLCESTLSCAEDTINDGHRANIMNSTIEDAGMGYVSYYWTQDFVKFQTSPAPRPKIVAGSHVMIGSELYFLVNYYAPGDAALNVSLILDGVPTSMTRDLGADDAGTWSITASIPTTCIPYHFIISDASGQPWRYPGEGEFTTYGIAGCTQDYQVP